MKVPFLDLSLQHQAIRTEALAALAATYDATRFCLGQDVDDFERGFSQTLGYPAALGLNSGTAPLHMACLMAGFGPGDEVITTPFTFISSAWGISYTGARPVFADIEPETYNLDPAKLEAAITPRTKGIVVVHLFGLPARMDEIMAVARKHGLFVIEDCAQAVGAQYRGTPVGLLGDVGTFSFYPTKNLGACGEAGMLVARDEKRFARARLMRVHGSPRRYAHEILGGNWRMDGFQAAVLNIKLPRLRQWTARRREIARHYAAGIRLREAALPTIAADYGESVLHQFTLTHPQRDALREHLTACGVGTDLIYPLPLHLQKCYADLGYAKGSFPVAEQVAEQCLSLPIFPELTDAQVEHVIASVNAFNPAAR
ncbi:erythromycin biosynthesis sensory transduction protein eryC1 [Cephaloticoccus capnophilus]|uniref:Erythromycin biosynthesis sensory transduction protein eryC1 n=1 Tax=Cephaloticoccus capnophilus TaxID=1548208 RepID=A0A139STS9_9BACT|nr:DegT/DnrJ/EryC1/StrS family aminotransferase [Cephaloticoccus capnophilus]KXU37841.1 erythromycin biosynthesis sensory transduction protein eryC1 [Cephaloticoccus capnophilus]